MYQFTTTTVINSALDSSGIAKYVGAASSFEVKRVNKFLKANIVDIHKRPYQAETQPGRVEGCVLSSPV